MRLRNLLATGVLVAATVGVVTPAEATHSWGGYHWARTGNPFTLKLGSNVSSAWTSALTVASLDWNGSTVLKNTVLTGSLNPRTCKAQSGTVQVCNATFGSTGWLGIASISITGGTHITQGTVKLNDTYFNTAQYNKPEWRAMVTCQEIGHTFGLGHTDEVFNNPNMGTCMDYTNDPSGTLYNQVSNEHPYPHDYDMLASIYSHLDSTNTVALSTAAVPATPADQRGADRGAAGTPGEWGRLVSGSESPRHVAVYERDFGGGDKEVTFVTWA